MTPGELSATVLDTPDPHRLARFYATLLGWELRTVEADWVTIHDPRSSGPGLSFQREPLHRAPTWPATPTDQSMQMHLDVQVADLGQGVRDALELGARLERHQPQHDVRVLRDPDGHLFCLWASDEA